jgi:hypothetical protein
MPNFNAVFGLKLPAVVRGGELLAQTENRISMGLL